MKHRIEIENKIVRKLFLEFDVCERSYLNFNKCDFITMKHNISSVDWNQFFSTLSTDIYMETFLDKLAEICSSSAPLLKKNCKRISSFHKERKTLMKKRTKFLK